MDKPLTTEVDKIWSQEDVLSYLVKKPVDAKQEIAEKIYAKAGELQWLIDEARNMGLTTSIRTVGYKNDSPMYVDVSETIEYKKALTANDVAKRICEIHSLDDGKIEEIELLILRYMEEQRNMWYGERQR